MTRQLALSIAVSKVEGFAVLPGALQGATDFAAWATRQGFDVICCDDRTGDVHAGDLKDLITGELSDEDVSRLFVYFAGHGVARGYMDDIWLMSGAPADDADAINLARSLASVRKLRIPHVAIFADACRSAASAAFFNTQGQSLFSVVQSKPDPDVEVDLFLATGSGDRSWELQSRDDPRLPAYGIYTDCLMAALTGEDRGAVTAVTGGLTSHSVQSRPLARHLNTVVPEAARAKVGELQFPESVPVTYWEPNVIAWIPGAQVAPGAPSPDDRDTTSTPPPDPPTDSRTDVQVWAERLGDPGLRSESERSQAAQASRLGQPDTTLSLIDGEIVGMAVAGGASTVTMGESEWTDAHLPAPASAVLALDRDRQGQQLWPLAAAIPGYRVVLTVGSDGVDSMEYVPSQAATLDDYPAHVIAQATALARRGWLHADLKLWEAGSLFEIALEDLNPTLAVLAGYALERAGQSGQVEALLAQFLDSGRHVPFDLALIAGRDDLLDEALVVPRFPLMTRGWAFLEDAGPRAELARLVTPHLAPTVWATGLDLPDALVPLLLDTSDVTWIDREHADQRAFEEGRQAYRGDIEAVLGEVVASTDADAAEAVDVDAVSRYPLYDEEA